MYKWFISKQYIFNKRNCGTKSTTWKYGNRIDTNGEDFIQEGLDFPVYYEGTEPSHYDQACTVLAMDGVTLQELATIFPDAEINMEDNIETLLEMNRHNSLLSNDQDEIEDRHEDCDNSQTESIG